MSGKTKERRELLESEVLEIEALVRKYQDAKDPEPCWARYLLVKYLLARRERLRELRGER